MNKVILSGNVGKKEDLKYSANGLAILSFSLATNEYQGKDKEKRTDWHRCKAFGKVAETIDKFVDKGTSILAEGKVSYSVYEKDGFKKYTTDIIVNTFEFLSSKRETKSEVTTQTQAPSNKPNTPKKIKSASSNTFSINQPAINTDFSADDIPF